MHNPVKRIALQCLCLVVAPTALAGAAFQLLSATHVGDRAKLGACFEVIRTQPVAVFLGLFLLCSVPCRMGLRLLESQGVITRPREPWNERGNSRRALRFVVAMALASATALLVRVIVCQPYRVLSASMLPTLEPGAWIFANKLSYGLRIPGTRRKWLARLPKRGDVVALETPPGVIDAAPQLVKRVIALPGDRITMRGGRPVINGWPVPVCDAGVYDYPSDGEPTRGRLLLEFLGASAYLTLYVPERARFAGYTVQPGEVFVLGDNRNNSSDSRAWDEGRGAGIPLSEIDGRIVLRSLRSNAHFSGESSALAAGIARCLRDAPQQTTPPARGN